MSDPETQGHTPWLRVHIEHRFGRAASAFAMHVTFKATARRVVLFGPSGSGKSSVLRAIAGLLRPQQGQIQLYGNPVWRQIPGEAPLHVPAEQRRVGLVMQNPAVFPHRTTAGNVGFALRGLPKSVAESRVAELLQLVEAEPLANRWPHELSGGQLQRVAIARTLAASPRILLLDEPFAALDATARQRISENVHDWAARHSIAVLTVTHDLEEAFAAGDCVFAMWDGRILAEGKPYEVLAAERDRLVRALSYGPET